MFSPFRHPTVVSQLWCLVWLSLMHRRLSFPVRQLAPSPTICTWPSQFMSRQKLPAGSLLGRQRYESLADKLNKPRQFFVSSRGKRDKEGEWDL